MTSAIITVLLLTLAVARATRVLTTDQITEKPRMWIINRLGVDHPVTYLVHCQWCVSVWLGLVGAAVSVWLAPFPDVNPVVQVVGIAGGMSYVTGALGEKFGAQVGGEA